MSFSPTLFLLAAALAAVVVLFGLKNVLVAFVVIFALVLVTIFLLSRIPSKSSQNGSGFNHPNIPSIPWGRVYTHETSCDSRYTAAIAGNDIHVWDAHREQVARTLVLDEPISLAFSPDSGKLAVGTADAIYVCELPEMQQISSMGEEGDWYGELKFSPDGRYLASANEDYPPLSVWDVNSGRRLLRFDDGYGFVSLSFSSDSRILSAKIDPYCNKVGTDLFRIDGDRVTRLPSL
jgi:WD40 repeat protein